MSRKVVKVVVTTYNRRAWAKLAIDSVLAQTHQGFHLVIVDDASTDGTAELALDYAAGAPEKVTAVIKPDNRGIGDSIRLGIASGPATEYVAFLNDDDLWLPEKQERQLDLFRREPRVGLTFTGADLIDAEGQVTGMTYADLHGRPIRLDFGECFYSDRACASTLMMRSDLAARMQPSFPNLNTWDSYILMVAAGLSRIAMLDESLALYRDAPASIHTNTLRMQAHNARGHQLVFDLYPEIPASLSQSASGRRNLALMYLHLSIWPLCQREWRVYAANAWSVIRQHQVRPIVWLGIHTLCNIVKPKYARYAVNTDQAPQSTTPSG